MDDIREYDEHKISVLNGLKKCVFCIARRTMSSKFLHFSSQERAQMAQSYNKLSYDQCHLRPTFLYVFIFRIR